MTLWLKSLGAEVTGFSLPAPTNPSFFSSVQLEQHCQSHFSNILNLEDLKQKMAAAKPDIVFHMAAQALVHPATATARLLLPT